MPEKTLNARVLYRAKKRGWRVVRIQRSQVGIDGIHRTGTVKGFPDLMLFKAFPKMTDDWKPSDFDGGIVFVELKKELGKLDPEQEAWRDLIRGAGGDWHVFRPSDLRAGIIEEELNRG